MVGSFINDPRDTQRRSMPLYIFCVSFVILNRHLFADRINITVYFLSIHEESVVGVGRMMFVMIVAKVAKMSTAAKWVLYSALWKLHDLGLLVELQYGISHWTQFSCCSFSLSAVWAANSLIPSTIVVLMLSERID